ncbi:PepSY domain-containing protein [Streptomyces zagrosensis]|uniref:Putative membrane protein YkoI n=1 Tax=Streptomyces zagrosensis TaxID=1042984 RepID=A0A7W9UYB9_9ACTN|nr:PepSY domain-containing protein [Streptomyces zagrosensis]MBB5935790.1 putative membrane protein YkoI [Streptomyces zagrosensis]
MKRNLVIATVAAAALIGGGTASAVAFTGDGDGGPARQSQAADTDHADDDGADGSDGGDGGDGGDQADGDDQAAGDEDRGDDGAHSERADGDDGDDDGTDDAEDSTEDAADRREDAAEDKAQRDARVTVRAAVDAALKATPGAVVSIDLDADDGARAVWDVDLYGKDGRWHDLTLDANTARVLHQHVAHEDDAAALKDGLQRAKVSAAEAADDALRTVPGTVTSAELDDDDRVTAWDVDVLDKDGKKHELRVDLASGKVSQHPEDHDDAYDDDDSASNSVSDSVDSVDSVDGVDSVSSVSDNSGDND